MLALRGMQDVRLGRALGLKVEDLMEKGGVRFLGAGVVGGEGRPEGRPSFSAYLSKAQRRAFVIAISL